MYEDAINSLGTQFQPLLSQVATHVVELFDLALDDSCLITARDLIRTPPLCIT